MRKWVLFILFSGFLLSSFALEEGTGYRIENAQIETTSGETFGSGTRLLVLGEHNGWAIAWQRLDEKLKPIEPTYYSSKHWMEQALQPLSLNEVVLMVSTPQEELEQTVSSSAIICSARPPSRPQEWANESEADEIPFVQRSLPLFKNNEDRSKYFSCYKKNNELQSQYENQYAASLNQVSRAFANVHGDIHPQAADTLLSCLMFRESAHWEGGQSHTGALGLGQFTQTARDQIKEVLNYNVRSDSSYEERELIQRDEHRAGRLSQSEMRRNISIIMAERRRNARYAELQKLWNEVNLDPRPSANQITGDFVKNNSNHKAIFTMSSLLIRDCELRMWDEGISMDSEVAMLACAGAYNIGIGGFLGNAINKSGEQSLESWIKNLEDSGHPQSRETRNHLISINRCIDSTGNYPPCGTSSTYCQDLPKANACQDGVEPRCVGECQ